MNETCGHRNRNAVEVTLAVEPGDSGTTEYRSSMAINYHTFIPYMQDAAMYMAFMLRHYSFVLITFQSRYKGL